MPGSDFLMALAPSLAGNGVALTLGVAHGSSGDMPRLGSKKDEKGNPILDKDGNQQGGVPYDALTAGAGYAGAFLFNFLGSGKVKEIGTQVMLRVGDAGSYIYTYSWGGQMGQKSRKEAKNPDGTSKFTGQANSRTVTSGEEAAKRAFTEGVNRAAAEHHREAPEAELSRVFGTVNGTLPNTMPGQTAR